MKPITTFITLIVLCSTAVAQNSGRIYFNADWKECEKSVARYYRDYTRINDSVYRIEDFYLSGAKEMDAVARNFRGRLDEIGVRTNFWENGQLSCRVEYDDGKRISVTAYHRNGAVERQGRLDSSDYSLINGSIVPGREPQSSHGATERSSRRFTTTKTARRTTTRRARGVNQRLKVTGASTISYLPRSSTRSRHA